VRVIIQRIVPNFAFAVSWRPRRGAVGWHIVQAFWRNSPCVEVGAIRQSDAMRFTALLVAFAGASVPATGAAQPGAEARAEHAMRWYAEGELHHGYVILGTAPPAIALAGVLIALGPGPVRAGAIPVAAGSALILAIGSGMVATTSDRIQDRERAIRSDLSAFIADELDRMSGVLAAFYVVIAIEIAMLAGGAATLLAGLATEEDLAVGLGAGLAAEGATLLVHDLLAMGRARTYVAELERLSHTASLTLGSRF
jgi:hypothetical protein